MATKTPNFNLTKPSEVDLVEVDVLNGNMDIIDEALGNLSKKELVTVYAASLLSANWTNKTQTVSVPGLSLASAMVSVDYAAAMTQGQREAVRVAMLSVAGVTNNAVTVLCEGEMPGVDIPIVITEVLA